MSNERDNLATPSDFYQCQAFEAIREYAWNAGHDRPDQAWISPPGFDHVVPNPHYQGSPVPHPEDSSWDEDYE